MARPCPSASYAEESEEKDIDTWWCRDCDIRMCEGCVDEMDPVCPNCGTEQILWEDDA